MQIKTLNNMSIRELDTYCEREDVAIKYDKKKNINGILGGN